ncbi:MAG: S8 family serine peptidase [Verrucomicrobiota bacterium]|jgi:subtilisin-like proprotein convertase family protein
MRSRPWIWILLCLLLATGAWLLWLHGNGRGGLPNRPHEAVATAPTGAQARPFTILSTNNVQAATAATARANQFHWRLSNTTKTIGELTGDPHAILLANALIDTSAKLNLAIPKNLQAPSEPGAYIVQASGPVDNAFRALLAAAGAQIVSYIPNNAYLVTVSSSGANALAGNPMTQAVIPYEPYYKISSSMPVTIERKTSAWTPIEARPAAQTSLLDLAVGQKPLPAGMYLTLGLFNDGVMATVAQIEKLGGRIVAREDSPFGPLVRVQPPADWVVLAALPGVHIVEPSYKRAPANDLSRARVGVAADTQTQTNYFGLTGKHVLVEVNDSGIDATHPDFDAGGGGPVRVIGDLATSLVDTDGHGTHVAGIIAGDGTESTTVTNAQGPPGYIMPAVTNQFRGMAPAATLYSVGFLSGDDTNFISDRYLQETPARTNALISNNSWNFDGDTVYDLEAASYDAAVRDALPQVTGSQPVLFVFAAGNLGNGDDGNSPGSGTPDSIESPATAKNVITVGAIQELRNITNAVTNADGTISEPWKTNTSTTFRIAGLSSRGNVGIGTEGTFGRYKPDVVAPGTSIISTRSSQWDIGTYFFQSPTNIAVRDISVTVQTNTLAGPLRFPKISTNTVGVTIQLSPNARSPFPFPTDLPIYFALAGVTTYSGPVINQLSIPPDGGLGIPDILSTEKTYAFNYAISNTTPEPIDLDILLDTITTNNPGNYFLVYSNLDQSLGSNNLSSTGPGPYYRYETGTSMSAADVSGVLALMQDYFTNTLQTIPSPALLKAMLINGARSTDASYYNFQAQNATINFEGWGLINLPSSLPLGVTNQIGADCSSFFIDQNPTNALATGDSHTFTVTVNTNAANLPLRVTLVWTDPPGDPAAAIKLVNNLDLVVSNGDSSTGPALFYGNDIPEASIYNFPEGTNTPAKLDAINNVENVFISPTLGTTYYITVVGREVNVNAVTAQTNIAAGVYAPNVVQDFALVVSSGAGEVTNALTVTDNGVDRSASTTGQQVSFLGATNSPLLNQFVGANTPLLGTNTVPIGTISVLDTNGVPVGNIPGFATNAIVTVGMTNQWHFYVITNPVSGAANVTNAAFITFLPDTLSIPRMGVYSDVNATRPEADIDLYVTTDSTLTNLNPAAISNCVHGTQVGLSAGGVFNGASLSRGGTEFVVDIGSHPGQVYYVGVKSETQMASEYDFLPIFTSIPFSQMQNGNQVVNGQLIPVNIPDGTPKHPGIAYIFGLAIYPMTVGQTVVTNQIVHQNFGDLIGTLNHNGVRTVLNNHDSLGNPPGPYAFLYDDSGSGNFPGSHKSDGPGSLQNFTGTQGIGPWMLAEVDNSLTQTGSVMNFNLTIVPHKDLTHGVNVTALPRSFSPPVFIDVPVGYTNLTVFATNLPPSSVPPLELFVKLGSPPTLADTNFEVLLNNPGPLGPGNSISIGPPLTPGRYFVSIFNPDNIAHDAYLIATLSFSAAAVETVDFRSSGPVPILDDAVTYATITNNSRADLIQNFNVGLRVDHPRISDLVFHLISPDGTRYLLMENRGGTSTNGCGATIINSFFGPASSAGGQKAVTNILNTGQTSGSFIVNYNFFPVPDQMTIYASANPADFSLSSPTLITNTGFINLSSQFSLPYNSPSGFLTIIMNQFGNTNPGTAWNYTASGYQTNYLYLAFTENTNRTTTPIKFAPPPFVPPIFSTNLNFGGWESAAVGDYVAPTNVAGWDVISNQVSVVFDPPNAQVPPLFLALANGTITTNLPTTIGTKYTLTYGYRGPGIVGWWRGENNTLDELGVNNGIAGPGLTYGAAEVDQGFVFNNTNAYVKISNSPSLNVGAGPGLTLEAWINPTNVTSAHPIFEWNSNSTNQFLKPPVGVRLWIIPGGILYANLADPSGGSHPIQTFPNAISANVFQHVALTYNRTTGQAVLYTNGAVAAIAGLGVFVPQTTNTLWLGWSPGNSPDGQPVGGGPSFLGGMLDEPSVYNRALSASEIKAIHDLGSTGKFDRNPEIPAPQNLAEASVTIPGVNSTVVYGDNTNWQIGGVTFTAISNQTSLVITGLEPGILLDSFVLSAAGSGNNLYYQPEEDISSINNQSAFGTWTLEIQDDRAGAYVVNGPPMLQSWQLEFVFANTNFIPGPPNLVGGQPQTNTILPGGVAYFGVPVPTNADFATNILLFSTGPKNIWFDTNNPPTTNVFLFSGTNGSYTLSTTGTPPTNLVPGSIYYIGEQNTNSFPITNAFEVDFHLLNPGNPATNPIVISGIIATNIGGKFGFLLIWYAPTNDIFLVQWTGDLNQPIIWNTFSNIITYPGPPPPPTNGIGQFRFFDDGSQFPFGPTRFYRLLLVTSLGNGVAQTNIVAPGSVNFFLVNVPTNAVFATNLLLFATGPVNLLFNEASPPTVTGTGDYTLLAGATNGLSILSDTSAPTNIVPGGLYWLGVQNTNSFAVTNAIEVDFDLLSGLPTIITLTNRIPYLTSNSGAGSATDYYLYRVTPAAARVQFEVDNPSGDVTLVARFGLPPPSLATFDYLSENPYTNGELIVVLTNSTPVALAPGNWYLSVVNISGAPVTYSVMATEWPATGRPINITGVQYTPPVGTNSGDFCITWDSLPGVYYYVQGITDLTTTNWVTVSPTILATTNVTTYCVTLPSPYNFFQVVEGIVVNNYAPPPVVSVTTQTNGDFLLQWRGPATFGYQVQWTSSLGPPIVWTTVPGVITSNTGLFTFLDDGSLTGGLGPIRFYQLIVLP